MLEEVSQTKSGSETFEDFLRQKLEDTIDDAARQIVRAQERKWMTPVQAASYLGWESVASFMRSDAPRRYLSPRVIRFNRDELDEWGGKKPRE